MRSYPGLRCALVSSQTDNPCILGFAGYKLVDIDSTWLEPYLGNEGGPSGWHVDVHYDGFVLSAASPRPWIIQLAFITLRHRLCSVHAIFYIGVRPVRGGQAQDGLRMESASRELLNTDTARRCLSGRPASVTDKLVSAAASWSMIKRLDFTASSHF